LTVLCRKPLKNTRSYDSFVCTLQKWIDEIKNYDVFREGIKEEQREEAAFEENLRVARVQEEHGYADPGDRVVVYDAKEKYGQLLSKVFDPKAASCCFCHHYRDGEGELKFLPCRHAIHNDRLCFGRWYRSSLPNDLKCPTCKRRINVLEKPLRPLTQRYWGEDCDNPGRRKVMSPSHREENDENDENGRAVARADVESN
jgi:hypothetical protein